MLRIVVLDGHTLNPGDISWSPFEKYGSLTIFASTPPEKISSRATDAQVLVVNKVIVSKQIMTSLPDLKMIIVTATGMNNIDHAAAKELNISVRNVGGYSTESVAQQVFAYLLHIENRVDLHSAAVRRGDWQSQPHFSFSLKTIHQLSNKTIGIYGFGTIGKRVAEIAEAFKMRILVHSNYPDKSEENIHFVTLEDLFSKSDFISVHTQLTAKKEGIINYDLLAKMKQTAWLINTARGGLINEVDLSKALDNNLLAGASLDVLSTEPPEKNHPLVGRKDVIITPHNAWSSLEARSELMQLASDHLEELI